MNPADGGLDPVTLVAGAADALSAGAGFRGAADMVVLLAVLSLAPALLLLCTCFTRIVVVLGLLHGHVPTWHVLLAPLVLAVQLTFTLGLVYLLSAVNVAFRDLQHVVGNLVTLWFFVTPVLYPVTTVPEQYRALVTLANPMAGIIRAYQALFYEHTLPDFLPLAVVFAGSLALLALTTRVFESRRELFAEIV